MRIPFKRRTAQVRARLESGARDIWYRRYTAPHTRFTVTTQDDVRIRGVHLRSGHETLLVYCHGFLGSKNYTVVPRFVQMLAEDADVIAFDFRGHGESEGLTTLGTREERDVAAVLEYARTFGYRRIYLVGSSMGGAVSLYYAARHPEVTGVATIGAFAHARFSFLALQAVKILRHPFAHSLVRFARQTQVGVLDPQVTPLSVVSHISPRPLLLIHGEFDPLIPVSHAYAMYQAAGEPKKLIVIPRGDHDLPNLNRRTKEWIFDWIRETASL